MVNFLFLWLKSTENWQTLSSQEGCDSQMPTPYWPESSQTFNTHGASLLARPSYMQVQCQICHMEFSNISELKLHIQLHHAHDKNAFPFVCDMCNRGFFSQRGLQHHKEKHSAGFECQMCSKKFSYSRNLKRHQEVFHSIKECRYCKRMFNIAVLNSHIMSCPYESYWLYFFKRKLFLIMFYYIIFSFCLKFDIPSH